MTLIDFDPQALPWVDRADFPALLAARREEGAVGEGEAALLEGWRADGFLYLPGAVEASAIDALLASYEAAWAERPDIKLLIEGRGVTRFPKVAARRELPTKHFRVMDIQDVSEPARAIMLHPAIIHHLLLIFGDTPVAMQSLFFEYGSEQHLHQDFPFVQAQHLSHLVGCWVACEDVTAENGPLFYYPGSHQVPKFDFGGGSLRYDGEDEAKVDAFEAHLAAACAAAGLERRVLHAKKGDVFLWHAALVHGGSPTTQPDRSRKSLVIHYSTPAAYPRDRRWPDFEPHVIRRHGGCLYATPNPSPLARLGAHFKAALRRLRG